MLAPVLTDVQDWLEEAVAGFFAVATEKDIVLSLEVGASVRQVEVDRERLSQVLGNILDNALRYTPDGGQIIVAASLESDDIMITVTDTGPGVSSKQLLHLFERFWRGDPSRSRRTGGSGLGLAVAQQIVEAHGGRIWAENVSTGGLRVRFSLPRK
jgi:signal transduction histidine kinase